MFTLKRLIGTSLILFVVAGTGLAQESRAPIETLREPVATATAAPLVTATATAKRVRFVSPGTVVQLRLEVYNEAGQKLFDTELHGGNVLDWHLVDGAGERVPAGSYATVLTIKSLSGRLSQRTGLVTVNDSKTVIETAAVDQFSIAQQQTIGPVEANSSFTILQQSEAEAITTVTHDGTEGQLGRTRGPLTFRVGDIFSGKDKEQMRLTEDGRLGIGTSDPKANLDVAGTIRAERVVIAKPGKAGGANKTVSGDAAEAVNSEPGEALLSGSGTQDRIAKWTDNTGTLGDSAITETAGKVGIGTTAPGALLTVSKNPTALQAPPPLTVMQLGNADGSAVRLNLDGYVAPGQLIFRRANTTAASPSALQSGDLIGRFGGWGYGATGYGPFTTANIDFSADQNWTDSAQGSRITFSTTANGSPSFPVERMRVDSAGNIGIGATNPQAKLDVSGNINTSTQYNIGGNRILSTPGSNTFVGINSGVLSNSGFSNTFMGYDSGANLAGANYNSFFGRGTGYQNTSGYSNTFIGMDAGVHNSTGFRNTAIGAFAHVGTNLSNAQAIGYRAMPTTHNSLVLGSIRNVNSAAGGANVGIGMTAPRAKLHIRSVSGVGLGLLSSSGTTVTGSGGALFTVELHVGDAITADGQTRTVASITDDDTLTVSAAFSPVLSGDTYTFQEPYLQLTDVADATKFMVSEIGNVGINTDNPLAPLHVNGASILGAVFTGDLTVNGTLTANIPAGDSSYIQSNPAAQQSGANFNISGNGTAAGTLSGAKVGIGTSTPNAKLQVVGGDAAITTQSNGLILRATDGTKCFRVTVNNTGTLSTTEVTCPL